jgi:hypothetical protein
VAAVLFLVQLAILALRYAVILSAKPELQKKFIICPFQRMNSILKDSHSTAEISAHRAESSNLLSEGLCPDMMKDFYDGGHVYNRNMKSVWPLLINIQNLTFDAMHYAPNFHQFYWRRQVQNRFLRNRLRLQESSLNGKKSSHEAS